MPRRSALKGIDLLSVEEYEVPRRYGLICTMGQAGGGTIPDALNRPENHDAIEAAFRTNIPLAAKAGVPNVITFQRRSPRHDATTKARATPSPASTA